MDIALCENPLSYLGRGTDKGSGKFAMTVIPFDCFGFMNATVKKAASIGGEACLGIEKLSKGFRRLPGDRLTEAPEGGFNGGSGVITVPAPMFPSLCESVRTPGRIQWHHQLRKNDD